MFVLFLSNSVLAESGKIHSVNYDDSSSVIYINAENSVTQENFPVKYVRLENPNRIYFDINDSVLVGQKQQLVFEKSNVQEIRLAQFSTNPNVVRAVITFDENFDTSQLKLLNINGNVLVKAKKMNLKNDYFNPIYNDSPDEISYSGIVANSQIVQKVNIPQQNINEQPKVVEDINKAFANSTLNNSDGKTYDSVVSIDLSSDLKLRTRYFINGYYYKNGGLLVSGMGQMTAAKIFTLDSPKRIVIDLPNSFVDKRIRNKEVMLCPNGACKDVAKIGQFEFNKARIVVTTDKLEKYIPIYSYDAQSMLFINADYLDHTTLSGTVANIQKSYIKRINSQTTELILSFTSPVVHSIIRDNNQLTVYLFNVKSYNEPEILKTLKNSSFKNFTLSLLPQVGVKGTMKVNKDDIIQISQGVDGKSMKFTITTKSEIKNFIIKKDEQQQEQSITVKKPPIKNKVVLDAGHGGTDYGAIREGINEKDITLDLTNRVAALLKSKGYKVAFTRKDDTFVSLEDRVDISENENPEIFVSIHVNSAVATEPSGIETHYYHEYSKELANTIQNHLIKNIDSKNRGILKSKFYVINHTTVPAVLVETGFLSNPQERADLITEKRKQATAKSIADGIMEYLKSTK